MVSNLRDFALKYSKAKHEKDYILPRIIYDMCYNIRLINRED